MTSVTYAHIPKDISTEDMYSRLCRLFPHTESITYLGNIASRKDPESVKESLAALLLLGGSLLKNGIDASDLVLKRSAKGKPLFEGSELFFSISHSRGYAAAALSSSCAVGVDIECAVIARDKACNIAKRFFSEDEIKLLNGDPSKFREIWTKKEAYVKMRGITLAEAVSCKKNMLSDSKNSLDRAFFESFDADGSPLSLCLEKHDDQRVFFKSRLEDLM